MSYRIDDTCQTAGKHGNTFLLSPRLGAQDQMRLPLLQQLRRTRANRSVMRLYGQHLVIHTCMCTFLLLPPVHCGHGSL